MAAKGALLVLAVGDDPTETLSNQAFVDVGGIETTSFTMNSEEVSVSNISTNGWRTFLHGAGLKMLDTSFSGIYENTVGEDRLRAYHEVQNAALTTAGKTAHTDFAWYRVTKPNGDAWSFRARLGLWKTLVNLTGR